MNRLLIFPFLMLGFLLFSCEKQVIFEPVQAEEQVFCESDPFYLGSWQSDSVWITTEVDTLDSLIVNKTPGLTYLMQIDCSDTLKSLQLDYFTFAGVRTLDLLSSNFSTEENAINVFGQLDSIRTEADLVFNVSNRTDSTFEVAYSRELGNGQRSKYQLFFQQNSI